MNAWPLITAVICLGAGEPAIGRTNDYSTIWRRNAFALNSPAATNSAPAAPVLPPPVKLTGIAILPPQKWAAFQIQEVGKSVLLLTLKEGASHGPLQVLEVDRQARSVVVRYDGHTRTLSFETDGASVAQRPALPPAQDLAHAPLPVFPPPDSADP